jgi:hypothetical protein
MDMNLTESRPSTQIGITRRTALIAAATGMSLAAAGTTRLSAHAAQQATPVASPAAEDASYLFVQSGFSSGTLIADAGETFNLVLQGAPEQTVFFSDRPSRVVGAVATERFLEELGFEPSDPPNAALVIQTDDGTSDVIVLELTSPVYDAAAGTMSYVATLLEGFTQLEATGAGFTEEPLAADSIPAAFGPSSLFIDSLLSGCSPWDPRC